MTEVVLRGIEKAFGRTPAVRGVDLDAPSGGLTVLLGPSGCGKTTLLRLIAGLEEADAGEIRIGGRRVNALPPRERDVAIVFQSYALYPHMTVFQNLAFALKMGGMDKAAIARRVAEVAKMLQIEDLLDRRPRELSGGQQQRVAMGRAMVRQPKVYLFDEPLSNLDARLRAQMRVEITRLQRELGTTMIYVTHDQVEAMTLADHVVVLDRGRVAQAGPPLDIYNAPANLFVAGFLGSPPMNLYPTRVLERREGTLSVALPRGARVALRPTGPSPEGGATVTLGIRPEHLQLGAQAPPEDGATLEAAVTRVERLGAQSHVALSCEDMELVAVADGEARISAGERLRVHLPARRCRLFDAEGQAV